MLPHSNADVERVFFGGWSQQDEDKKQLGPRWTAFLHNDKLKWQASSPASRGSPVRRTLRP